jgi:hypothetical protein
LTEGLARRISVARISLPASDAGRKEDDMAKPSVVSAQWTKLNNRRRTARRAAADFAFDNRPLSPAQVEEHRAMVAAADATQDACDAFYAANAASAGGALNC